MFKKVLLIVLSLVGIAIGSESSQFSSSSSPFLYSQSLSLDLSSDVEEEDALTSDTNINISNNNGVVVDDDDDESIDISSSLLYSANGCYVSSQSYMGERSGANKNLLDRMRAMEEELSDEEEEENEDDDEDDDGHSSMLSNSALRRTHAFVSAVGGEGRSIEANAPPTSPSSETKSGISCESVSFCGSRQMWAISRGGAVASASASLGNEVLRRLFVTALVTLIFEAMIGHILEFTKIVMQTSDIDRSYVSVFRDITNEKGIAGLWDGFAPWGIVQAVFKGAVFGMAYATALSALEPWVDQGTVPKKLAFTIAGGVGGGFQGYVLSPTLLLKTRVMTDPIFRESMSILRTTLLSFRIGFDVVAREGIATLMKGSNVFAMKRVCDWASRYFFSDLFESLFVKMKGGMSLSIAEKSLASFLGGVASTCVTLPLDVLVAKTQDAKKAGVKVSAWKLFLEDLNKNGWEGLRRSYMRGFEARLFHVCLTTVVVKTGTPIVYNLIFGES